MKNQDQTAFLSPSSHPRSRLQGRSVSENCDSSSRLVVDEDDNGKFKIEKGKRVKYIYFKTVECTNKHEFGLRK